MITSPFVALLHSRKFLIAMWDFIVGAVVLIGGWYIVPQDLDKIIQVFALLQVPVSILIGAIAWEDNAERGLKKAMYEADKYAEESIFHATMKAKESAGNQEIG